MDELEPIETLPLAEMKAKLRADQTKLNQLLAPNGEAKTVADSKDATDDSHANSIEDRTKGKGRANEEESKGTLFNSTTSAKCQLQAGNGNPVVAAMRFSRDDDFENSSFARRKFARESPQFLAKTDEVHTKGASWNDPELGLSPDLVRYLIDQMGYPHASVVERQVLAHLKEYGMTDMRIVAPLGSCKTAAYLLPIILSVDKYLNSRNPATGGAATFGCVYAVVLAPTRRLASQIWKDAKDLATVFPRVNVLLCMNNPNNTMGGNLQAIEAGFGQIIVCTLGRLFTLSQEETTQHVMGETYRKNVEHSLGRLAEQIHRCPTWSIFGSVKILAVDQATDMLGGDYKEDIDRLKKSVIPKFAGGYSIVCICADYADEIENEPDGESAQNSYQEITDWFDRKGTRKPFLHLEVTRAVHANLQWNIKLRKIEERNHPGPVHNGHLQLCMIKLPPAAPNGQFPRTLIITERQRDANITAEWIASMNKGAYHHLVCVMHGGQSVVDNEANHNLFLNEQKSICCATSAMVRGGNLKVERLYVMFLPQLSKTKGIFNLLDAMGRVGEINIVFEQKDAAVAKALRDYFSVNQTSSKQCISDWNNLLKKFEDETPEQRFDSKFVIKDDEKVSDYEDEPREE